MAAIPEKSGLMKPIDANGDVNIFYPIVRADDVAGLGDKIAENMDASKISYNGRTVKTALEDLEAFDAAPASQGVWYGVCSTTYSTATKAVATDGFTDANLVAGTHLRVKFTAYNSAGTPYLKINSGTAKLIKSYGTTAAAAYMWQSGAIVDFVYDGNYWVMVNGTLATTTYYGLTKLSSATYSTDTSMAATSSAVKTAYDRAATLTGRSSAPSTADTDYTTYKCRGEALFSTETTPSYNGQIAWQYE